MQIANLLTGMLPQGALLAGLASTDETGAGAASWSAVLGNVLDSLPAELSDAALSSFPVAGQAAQEISGSALIQKGSEADTLLNKLAARLEELLASLQQAGQEEGADAPSSQTESMTLTLGPLTVGFDGRTVSIDFEAPAAQGDALEVTTGETSDSELGRLRRKSGSAEQLSQALASMLRVLDEHWPAEAAAPPGTTVEQGSASAQAANGQHQGEAEMPAPAVAQAAKAARTLDADLPQGLEPDGAKRLDGSLAGEAEKPDTATLTEASASTRTEKPNSNALKAVVQEQTTTGSPSPVALLGAVKLERSGSGKPSENLVSLRFSLVPPQSQQQVQQQAQDATLAAWRHAMAIGSSSPADPDVSALTAKASELKLIELQLGAKPAPGKLGRHEAGILSERLSLLPTLDAPKISTGVADQNELGVQLAASPETAETEASTLNADVRPAGSAEPRLSLLQAPDSAATEAAKSKKTQSDSDAQPLDEGAELELMETEALVQSAQLPRKTDQVLSLLSQRGAQQLDSPELIDAVSTVSTQRMAARSDAEAATGGSFLPLQLAQFSAAAETQQLAGRTMLSPALLSRIGELAREAQRAGDGEYQATLRLDPPSLGRVEINLQVQGNTVALQFASSNGQARRELRESAAALKQSLTEAGLNVADIEIVELDAFADSTDADGGRNEGQAQRGSAEAEHALWHERYGPGFGQAQQVEWKGLLAAQLMR